VSHAVVALAPILLVSAAVNADQTPEQAFLAATASFGKGDYAAAERQFAACRRAVGDHPTVDFNLAMTYLRLEQPGRARVYLERVLKQSPRDREARDELRHVLAGLDQPPPPSPSGLHAMWHGLKANVTRRGAVNVAAILFTLAASGLDRPGGVCRRRCGMVSGGRQAGRGVGRAACHRGLRQRDVAGRSRGAVRGNRALE
jgi:hypothetical protein